MLVLKQMLILFFFFLQNLQYIVLNTAMYWIFDGLCFLAGVAAFILSFTQQQPSYCWVGPVWIAIYPIINEIILNIVAYFCSTTTYTTTPRSHFVYHPNYNISFCGIEKLHPFDSKKYGNIYERLVDRGLLNEKDTIVPDKAPRKLLMQVMSKWYLLKLCYTIPICSYIQMPLIFLPGFLLRWRVLDPMVRAAQGSVLAATVAQQLGWAVNLSGGFHHATKTQGGGFCIYPDITLIVTYLRTRMNKRRIMIVDLDAHQGNGYQRDLLEDNQVYIVDFYNHNVYPGDRYAKQAIKKDKAVNGRTTDEEYIELVKDIGKDMTTFQPEFVIYNAGTDILQDDPLGRMNISANGIIKRDQEMVRLCVQRRTPVVMLLSGGYQLINAEIIANSMQNLLKQFK